MIVSRMKRVECWSDGDRSNPFNSLWARSISERSGGGEDENESGCDGINVAIMVGLGEGIIIGGASNGGGWSV